MKIAKALKQKNKLAGEVAKLKVVLGEQNSKPKGQDFAYNNDEFNSKGAGKSSFA